MIARTLVLFLFFFTATTASAADDSLGIKIKRLLADQLYDSAFTLALANQHDLDGSGLNLAGQAAYFSARDAHAELWFKAAIARNSYLSEPYYYLSRIYAIQGSDSLALRYAKAAVRLDRYRPPYLVSVGQLFRRLGQLDSASRYLHWAVAMPAPGVIAWYELALLLHAQKNFQEASNAYSTCLYQPDLDSATERHCLLNYGILQTELGQLHEAEYTFEILLGKNRNDYQAMERLIQVYHQAGILTKAQYYRQKLYNAYLEGQLGDSKGFYFYVYDFKEYRISMFEYFADPADDFPYRFEVLAIHDDATMSQQFLVGKREGVYVVCRTEKQDMACYGDNPVGENLDRGKLKTVIKKSLQGKLTASERRNLPTSWAK